MERAAKVRFVHTGDRRGFTQRDGFRPWEVLDSASQPIRWIGKRIGGLPEQGRLQIVYGGGQLAIATVERANDAFHCGAKRGGIEPDGPAR